MTVFRAGFVAFAGRPNVGKSTLMNALVGKDITPTSAKPQTTRHAVRGVVHRPGFQLVIVDTPGLHKPRTLLGKRLNEAARAMWPDVDVVAMLFPADEPIGTGDRFILRDLAQAGIRSLIAVVTKTDRVSRGELAEKLISVQGVAEEFDNLDFVEIVPVCAPKAEQTELLAEVIAGYLPESPPLYPEDDLSDEPLERTIAETIRATAAEGLGDELPHSLAVVVDELERTDEELHVIGKILVERESQRPIVIGVRGAGIRHIRLRSQRRLKALLGVRVRLELHITVEKEWQGDPKRLARLGY